MSQPQSTTAPPPDSGLASGADAEIITPNQRLFEGGLGILVATLCILYTSFHIAILNLYPLETWTYRLIHVAGGLALGFLVFAAHSFPEAKTERGRLDVLQSILLAPAALLILTALVQIIVAISTDDLVQTGAPREKLLWTFGYPLIAGTLLAILTAWLFPDRNRANFHAPDIVLAVAATTVGLYFIAHADFLRLRAQVFPHENDMWASISGLVLILELTRRLAGLALVMVAAVFIAYGFLGPWLPGVFQHRGYDPARFFGFIYTDNGVLGPTTAISSTYIILFIAFSAFLQASRVGEYFINFAFAAAGHLRGGPAKVAVFGSALMGTINGTSAGNVVATGSLTIPLMKKVGYKPQTAASVEAAASTGGQIMPPIMGAGAFLMAEVTGIAYADIVVAAIIPALLYFVSVYFMVDLEALKTGLKGLPRNELPEFRKLARQAFLFAPIVILIYALFAGYSVIRAGTLAMAAAVVVSWLSSHRMGPRAILYALELAARMSLQLVAVCAAAGIIVGVIALTGVGTRFSALLLGIAASNQYLALAFAMVVVIVLGMGMPTTAAYAVAASVMAPGLIQMGIQPLVAHFFIFYFAVMSAITPPVALAAYAGAAIARSEPMRTSVESFKLGLAAFVVPFMFFASPALLMQGTWLEIVHVAGSATLGILLLASAIQGYLFGRLNVILRIILFAAALGLIHGGWLTDALGIAAAIAVWLIQRRLLTAQSIAHGAD